ncbi:lipase family protein [Geothrix mesophila]|uniref:lipase family protein n=1 Tax=Geothrix mesophila TaxID=2922723 RepID=UPI001FABA922|nr:hypothetical protein [Geothrix sp. SG198]
MDELVLENALLHLFGDIKTDIKARFASVAVGKETFEIHSGFLEAFQLVREDIEKALATAKPDQLIMTGHSLGGALAIVATRILAPDCVGACYTFGAAGAGQRVHAARGTWGVRG